MTRALSLPRAAGQAPLPAPRGDGGFGYDPLFIPDGESRHAAELTADEKNLISHRGKALKRLIKLARDDHAGIDSASTVCASAVVCTKVPLLRFQQSRGFSPSLQQPYVDALLSDLDSQLNWLSERPIGSIFIGGGTPACLTASGSRNYSQALATGSPSQGT